MESFEVCTNFFFQIKDQQEAEKKKVQSQEIQAALMVQEEKIAEKRKNVMADLSKVEPAVIEAQLGEVLNHEFEPPMTLGRDF